VLNWASKLGLAVRGIYGEGSKAKGCFYQLSNQITLGATEKDIFSRVETAAKELMEKEELVMKTIYENNTVKITDKCMRSFGILTNSYTLTSEEAFSLVSDVELGISLGIIKDTDPRDLANALFDTLPASISESNGGNVDASERDLLRAAKMREKLLKQ
jgi:protein arginine kinase